MRRRPPMIVAAGCGFGTSWLYPAIDSEATHIPYAFITTALGVWVASLSLGYGAIYAIYVRGPYTGRRVCGYVGKTTRYPVETRITEHLLGSKRYNVPAQPWED